jgi:hypothetical protein
MKIIRARLKPISGATEFISVRGRIKSLLQKNEGDMFHFVIDDGKGVRTVKEFGPENINTELVGQIIPIVDDTLFAKFNEDGTIEVVTESNEGALPRQSTVNQLKKLRGKCRGTDIGDRVSDMNKQGSNIQYIQNPIDTGIESFEDFERNNKNFIPGWNLKHLISPFRNSKKKKKKS